MKDWLRVLSIGLISLMAVGLTGCETEMRTVASSNDPNAIGSAVVSIYVIMAVVLFFFSDHGIGKSLVYGARYAGFILLILAPFQFMASNIGMGATVLVVAIVGIMLPKIMVWTHPPKPKTIIKHEGPAEETEDRLRIAEEKLAQQEILLQKQQRRIDGNDTPFR